MFPQKTSEPRFLIFDKESRETSFMVLLDFLHDLFSSAKTFRTDFFGATVQRVSKIFPFP